MKYLLIFFLMLLQVGCAYRQPINPVARADAGDGQCRRATSGMVGGFLSYNRCINNLAANDPVLNAGPGVDLVNRYLAGVNLLSERVGKGEISDAQAFVISAEYYGALKGEYLGRMRADADMRYRDSVLQQRQSETLMGFGAEMMRQGAPRTLNSGGSCFLIGNMVQCH